MNTEFEAAVQDYVENLLKAYQKLTYTEVAEFAPAKIEDIVISGKEVQLTIFKQESPPGLPDALLLTAQIVRAALGGIHSFHYEKGLVFGAQQPVREASDEELKASA